MKNGFHPMQPVARLGLRCSTAALPLALFLSFSPSAKAVTYCVDSTGTLGGCFTSISAAVAIAHPGDAVGVSPGTYHEQVTISFPITLIGNNPTTTFIDASGFANGIVVDGLHNPGLSQVLIRGFNIENANYEGILATNVSDLSIETNTIHDNDKNLSNGMCSGLPAIETGENVDCGEGIHLIGVTHSLVTENLLNNNAGGILLSDETGANHDNLITHNIITANPNASGVTLASYAASVPITAPQVTFGVYSNNITENAAIGNGGGGVALYAAGAGHTVAGNTITGNRMVSNGLAGVLLHAVGTASGGASAPNAGSNSIVENFIASNGPDPFAGAITTTGVAVYGESPVADVLIYGNTFATETVDVFFNSASVLSIHNNDLVGTTGLVNANPAGVVNARENYWGCTFVSIGSTSCSGIVGPNISFSPWLTTSINATTTTTTPAAPAAAAAATIEGTGKNRHTRHDWFCDHYNSKHWFFGVLKGCDSEDESSVRSRR